MDQNYVFHLGIKVITKLIVIYLYLKNIYTNEETCKLPLKLYKRLLHNSRDLFINNISMCIILARE